MSNSKHDIFEGPRSTLAKAFGEVCMREAAEKPYERKLVITPVMAKAWQDEYGYLPDDIVVVQPIIYGERANKVLCDAPIGDLRGMVHNGEITMVKHGKG